jgi:hypothetical protein
MLLPLRGRVQTCSGDCCNFLPAFPSKNGRLATALSEYAGLIPGFVGAAAVNNRHPRAHGPKKGGELPAMVVDFPGAFHLPAVFYLGFANNHSIGSLCNPWNINSL